MNRSLYNSRGSALLIALMLIGMLTLVGILAVSNSNTDIELSYNQSHADNAFYVAEAGAKQAFITLNTDDKWRNGYSLTNFGQGAYAVALLDSISDPSLDDTVVIRATGELMQAKATVELWTAPEYIYPFQFGLFGDKGIVFDQLGCTDSYNSDSGSYAATQESLGGSIGSNTLISTSKLVTIGGDAYTATGGTISLGAGAKITGDSSTTRDSVTLDAVSQAEYDYARDNSNVTLGMSGTNYTYNSGTKSLTIGSGGTVTLQSGVYYFSSLTAGQNCNIVLAPGANVRIYVTGDVVLGQYTQTNAAGTPDQLMLFSQGSNLQFDQYNTFVGAYYGPNAHIQYDQTTQAYGSLVGGSVKLDKGACFHYDRNLAKIKHGTTGAMLKVAWKEL